MSEYTSMWIARLADPYRAGITSWEKPSGFSDSSAATAAVTPAAAASTSKAAGPKSIPREASVDEPGLAAFVCWGVFCFLFFVLLFFAFLFIKK